MFDISFRSAKGTLLGYSPVSTTSLHLSSFHRVDSKQINVLQGTVQDTLGVLCGKVITVDVQMSASFCRFSATFALLSADTLLIEASRSMVSWPNGSGAWFIWITIRSRLKQRCVILGLIHYLQPTSKCIIAFGVGLLIRSQYSPSLSASGKSTDSSLLKPYCCISFSLGSKSTECSHSCCPAAQAGKNASHLPGILSTLSDRTSAEVTGHSFSLPTTFSPPTASAPGAGIIKPKGLVTFVPSTLSGEEMLQIVLYNYYTSDFALNTTLSQLNLTWRSDIDSLAAHQVWPTRS